MNKVIIISDSFKGTLSSEAISTIFKNKWLESFPDCEVISIPVADGGEGTCYAYSLSMPGNWVEVDTIDANNLPIKAKYYLMGESAVIEVASVVGLPHTKTKNPSITTTYGIGALIKDAISKGAETIYMGLGGSSTNDAGCGLASALGVKFMNFKGEEFIPVGGTLKDIDNIDATETDLGNVKIIGMCDVNNPFSGPNGAAYVYAPQKGADEEMVKVLDDGLRHLSNIIRECLGIDLESIEGTGAAGGIGGGLIAFLSAKLKPGIETLLDIVDFNSKLKGCDLVVSGEGRLDKQSFSGKVIDGVNKRTSKAGVPLALICGSATSEGILMAKYHGIDNVIISTPKDTPLDDMVDNADLYYEDAVSCLIRGIL